MTFSSTIYWYIEQNSLHGRTLVDQIQQIAAAAEQQTAVAHDIDQNIVQINQTGELTAQGADETAQASQDMSVQVDQLKTLISTFKM